MTRLGWRSIAGLLGYALLLGASHYFVIAPAFGYLGYQHVGPNLLVALAMVPTYVLCARRLPASWERPSTIVYWMLFLIVVAPVHVLPVFTANRTLPVWLMVGSVAAAFWLLGCIYSVRLLQLPRPVLPPRLFWPLFALCWLVLVVTVVSYYGFSFRLVRLSDIYAVRDTYRDSFEQVPRLARYTVTWLGNVIAPIALARGLSRRRWLWAVLAVATELFLVSITGFKQLLFASVLVAGVVLLVRTTDVRQLGRRVVVLVTTGVFAVTAFDMATSGWSLSSVLIRRLVLTSGVNTKYHFLYFSAHPKAHLGYGALSRWVDYPYDLAPPFLLGRVYYGNAETSANANLWADAFANFGLVGVVGFTVVLALLLHLTDSIATGLPSGLAIAALAQSAFSLSNTAMLTVFLTHGLLLAVVLIYLLPADSVPAHAPGEPPPEPAPEPQPDPELEPEVPERALDAEQPAGAPEPAKQVTAPSTGTDEGGVPPS